MGKFFNRIFRAIKIDIDLYEEVEKDKKATLQAAAVVVLASLAAGGGSIHLGVSNFLLAPLLSLLSWYVWAYIIYFIGVKLFPEKESKVSFKKILGLNPNYPPREERQMQDLLEKLRPV